LICSAPGKVFLFGEHAVVYGRHAVVSAINLRTFVKIERHPDFVIESPIGTTGLDAITHPYVTEAIHLIQEIHPIKGCRFHITSEIPVSSGLGSSAAVTVAVIGATNEEFNIGLGRDEIYELARKVEKRVQGIASGTDPFVSTFGGAYQIPEREKIDIKGLNIIIIYTGQESNTKKMVEKVAELRNRFPDIIEPIFDAIDQISLRGIQAIKTGDLDEINFLFGMNQGLLKSIGVSSESIDAIITDVERHGKRGKLTGAGGGGSVITLGSKEDYKMLKSLYPDTFLVSLENEGLKIHG